MAIAEHSIAPEQIQSYVDGELTREEAVAIETHLPSCPECRQVADDVNAVSRKLAAWQVEEVPSSVKAPVVAHELRSRVSLLASRGWLAAAVVVLAVGLVWSQRKVTPQHSESESNVTFDNSRAAAQDTLPPPPSATARPFSKAVPGESRGDSSRALTARALSAQAQAIVRAPMVVRTASLVVVARIFDDVRPALDRILARTGGFVGQISTSAARGEDRWLKGTVRVPATELATTLDALKQLGTVTSESQGGEDVTDQATDLDARLSNARETEKRLVQVLQQRTGRVADILEVEREIARVRTEIERMSAQRVNLSDRVTYATIALEIHEAQKASLSLDSDSVSGRLRNALIAGIMGAMESALTLTTFLVRVAPTLVLWIAILAWPAILVRRHVRGR